MVGDLGVWEIRKNMFAPNIPVYIVFHNNNDFDIEYLLYAWKSCVISTMFSSLKYEMQSPNQVGTSMRCPRYLYVLHVQILSHNFQLNSFFVQMSGLSFRINFNAFPKVVQKSFLVAVLAFFSSFFFSGVSSKSSLSG